MNVVLANEYLLCVAVRCLKVGDLHVPLLLLCCRLGQFAQNRVEEEVVFAVHIPMDGVLL